RDARGEVHRAAALECWPQLRCEVLRFRTGVLARDITEEPGAGAARDRVRESDKCRLLLALSLRSRQLRGVARDDAEAGQVVVRLEDRRGLAEVGARLRELAHLQVDHPGQMQRPGKVEAVRARAVHGERFAGGRERTL